MSAFEPTEQMIAEAALWMAQLQDEHADAQVHRGFEAWRAQHPGHALAAQRMQALWGQFEPAHGAAGRAAFKRGLSPSKRLGARSLLGLVGMASLAWALHGEVPVWLADQRTGVGERSEVTLADGSRVQLNSDSAIDIHLNGHQRVIELVRGEVWVIVAKDPSRPFVVRTEQGSVTALGTRFVVRREGAEATRVSVVESAVAAQANGEAPVRVAAGQWALLQGGQVSTPQRQAGVDPAGWTRGVLSLSNAPLVEVLDELARYRHGLLAYDRQALANLRVSGVFRLDDTDAALQALADNLPIDVSHVTQWYASVKPRKSESK
ncbi:MULTISPECIES: FecR family protein [unclassified Pseudomonas]|uniref:FecR family protein n=1 Tax=unclassified Pseudomonas TaxID=196821 RepID=UPI000BC697FE|nr:MULTISPECIES: FecR family protein [unclassified Pseudomonas]PVZ08827.1 FecR family protein [Pseudomonas sp. URIL14HWK12:I12]PVZ21249.1 FecR family protein [Pseudomonas sp. URIL14HWK12:I10]PVZ30111.1 FecR family protein [Pseudomonas sp. URIL14HWK12:I11]SNZ18846.1 FecR family protein [Pseudomonas sp. URIL14HWK12:I9]